MRKDIIYTFLVFVVIQMYTQKSLGQDIVTNSIKGSELITYAADFLPSEETQQIYLLIEIKTAMMDADQRFFLNQGIALLLKRLNPKDKIAIGTYGITNHLLLPHTEVSEADVILKTIEKLYQHETQDLRHDGIDIAYTYTEQHHDVNAINRVVMLRSNTQVTENITANKTQIEPTSQKQTKEHKTQQANGNYKLGGAIAITALSILPEVLEIIKDEN